MLGDDLFIVIVMAHALVITFFVMPILIFIGKEGGGGRLGIGFFQLSVNDRLPTITGSVNNQLSSGTNYRTYKYAIYVVSPDTAFPTRLLVLNYSTLT